MCDVHRCMNLCNLYVWIKQKYEKNFLLFKVTFRPGICIKKCSCGVRVRYSHRRHVYISSRKFLVEKLVLFFFSCKKKRIHRTFYFPDLRATEPNSCWNSNQMLCTKWNSFQNTSLNGDHFQKTMHFYGLWLERHSIPPAQLSCNWFPIFAMTFWRSNHEIYW